MRVTESRTRFWPVLRSTRGNRLKPVKTLDAKRIWVNQRRPIVISKSKRECPQWPNRAATSHCAEARSRTGGRLPKLFARTGRAKLNEDSQWTRHERARCF